MAIKNAYSKINIDQLFTRLQKVLAKHGANSIRMDYNNSGQVIALLFAIEFNGKNFPVKLPAKVEKVKQVLIEQGFKTDDNHAYRVAWRPIS